MRGGLAVLAVLLASLAQAQAPATQEQSPFTQPPGLEQDVRFWIRVYTEVTTDAGLLHDDSNLGLVYEVLRFDADMSPAARERRVVQAKARYAQLLRRFAAGDTENLSRHERRILHAFGKDATAAQFKDAIEHIRFQLGQADRFRDGLVRAAAWERHIARSLSRRGVPEEIAALPHVESSFNPAAYSRVGAAGLWQFMPSTARRFMRVDGLVDERLDPYSATDAAANLMLYNYRLLGTWPLAVTAYNHGPGGLRRAQDELGTSDIFTIVKRFQGATFGFASRNFYVAFLAALQVDRNAEKFFGPITRFPDTESRTVEMPDYIPVEAVAKAFKVDMGALRVLNPALRPPIWSGARYVPRGYAVRLPGALSQQATAAAMARLPPSQRYLAQRADGTYRVRRRESLDAVAQRNGLTLARLLAANGWKSAPELRRGQLLVLPLPASRADASMSPASAVAAAASAPALPVPPSPVPPPSPEAPPLPEEPSREAAAVARAEPRRKEPVSEQQAGSAALLPAGPPTGSADSTDYAVGSGDTIVVQAAETLGHYADWSGASAAQLRTLNRLHKSAVLSPGRKFKLALSRVTAAQFEAARRAYHHRLQETFFASHRISGTENYTVKHGESLWAIAREREDLPIWLVTQYNPDIDFNDVRPGTTITLPLVSAINRQ